MKSAKKKEVKNAVFRKVSKKRLEPKFLLGAQRRYRAWTGYLMALQHLDDYLRWEGKEGSDEDRCCSFCLQYMTRVSRNTFCCHQCE